MLLSEILDQLSVGEFSQISFGGKPGVLSDSNAEQMMLHINLGMSNLYKRFNIKTGTVKIQLKPDQYVYEIHSKNSVNKNGNSDQTVLDTLLHPFKDDINKIEKISAKSGTIFDLNDEGNSSSIFTPTMSTIEVPEWTIKELDTPKSDTITQLTVLYRAGYFPSVKLGDIAVPEITEVDIPPLYLEALLYFVASRVHNPIGMVSEFHQGNNYAAKFEAECQRIEMLGLQPHRINTMDKIRRNGWV